MEKRAVIEQGVTPEQKEDVRPESVRPDSKGQAPEKSAKAGDSFDSDVTKRASDVVSGR